MASSFQARNHYLTLKEVVVVCNIILLKIYYVKLESLVTTHSTIYDVARPKRVNKHKHIYVYT